MMFCSSVGDGGCEDDKVDEGAIGVVVGSAVGAVVDDWEGAASTPMKVPLLAR